MRIDAIDRSIIDELQADGRASLREIARKLGVAEGTIRARLKRLQDEEVLQVVAFADPVKLGASSMCLFFLRVAPSLHDVVLETLKDWSEICYLSATFGETDICAQVVCRDQTALWDIRQKIAALDGVESLSLLPEGQVHKIRFKQSALDE